MDQCRQITSKCLHYIANNCPNLRFISVEYDTGVGDEGITELVQKCPLLEKVHLNSCGITQVAAHSIAQYCRNITVLDMRYCISLGDENVRKIALYCSELQALNLSLCFNVTDVSIKYILQFCVHLRHLYIVHCKITDEGMRDSKGNLFLNPFNLKLIMQILPTLREEND